MQKEFHRTRPRVGPTRDRLWNTEQSFDTFSVQRSALREAPFIKYYLPTKMAPADVSHVFSLFLVVCLSDCTLRRFDLRPLEIEDEPQGSRLIGICKVVW